MKNDAEYKNKVAELKEATAELGDWKRIINVMLSEQAYYRIVNEINRRAAEREK